MSAPAHSVRPVPASTLPSIEEQLRLLATNHPELLASRTAPATPYRYPTPAEIKARNDADDARCGSHVESRADHRYRWGRNA